MEALKKCKPKRTLTNREKNLLIVLGFVIIFWAAFRFIILPQYNKLQALQTEKQEYELKITEINSLFNREDAIDKEFEELQTEMTILSDKYFFNLKQSEIIRLFYEVFSNENFEVEDVAFSELFEEEIEGIVVNRMKVDIPYRGSYLGVFETLGVISTLPKKMIVKSLAMDKNDEGLLSGIISLDLYSLENDIGGVKEVFSSEDLLEDSKNNPFQPFNNYIELIEDSIPNNFIVEEPYHKLVLENFESESFESARRDENKLFIDLLDRNIIIEHPPSSIGLWLNADGNSSIRLGMNLKDRNNQKINILIYEGAGWSGSKYIEASLPTGINLYPIQVENIYLESSNGNDNYSGVILDKLEVNYPKNDISGEPYIYHKIEDGDTLNSISMDYYNTKNKKNIIMEYNDLKTEDLMAGKMLIIPKLKNENK